MAKSIEHKLADTVADRLMRVDFDSKWFARALNAMGEHVQIKLFSTFVRMIEIWAIDYEIDTERSDDHMRILIQSKQLQDAIDRHHIQP